MSTNLEIIRDDGDDYDRERRLAPVTTAALAQSDALAQLDAAHRYPRSIKRFLNEAISLATLTQDIAESCIYSVPRGGKKITGPSVRLAEMMASAYGNVQVGARVVDAGETMVTAEGVCWDMEKNLRATVRVDRRITDRNGRRYNDDMIAVAGAAACSIALRNAIYRVVPRAYVDQVYNKAREVAVGNAITLADKRAKLMHRFGVLGITEDRVLARVGAQGIDDIGLDEMEILVGLGTALKDEDITPEEAFPFVVVATDEETQGKRMSLGKPKPQTVEAAPEPEPATQTHAQQAATIGTRLGLTADEQRAIRERVVGRSSAASITAKNLGNVIEAFKTAAEEKRGEVADPIEAQFESECPPPDDNYAPQGE